MAPESRTFTIYCPVLVQPVCENATTDAPTKIRALPASRPSDEVPPPSLSRHRPRKRTRQQQQEQEEQLEHRPRQHPRSLPSPSSWRGKDAGGSRRPSTCAWDVGCDKENIDPKIGEQPRSHPFSPSFSPLLAAAAAGRDRTILAGRRPATAATLRPCSGSGRKRSLHGGDGGRCRSAGVGGGSGDGELTMAPAKRKPSREPLRELWSSRGGSGGGNVPLPACLDALRVRSMR